MDTGISFKISQIKKTEIEYKSAKDDKTLEEENQNDKKNER